MTPVKLVVAHNLTLLRKKKGMTQAELAAQFNYSDKAVSKWEHAETMPDLDTLDRLARFYEVSLSDLVTEGAINENESDVKKERALSNVTKSIITALSVTVVWLFAFLLFYIFDILSIKGPFRSWIVFLWAVPASLIILLVFNAIWGNAIFRTILIIGLVWAVITCVYLQLGHVLPEGKGWELWAVFLIGIPPTVAALLWGYLSRRGQRKKSQYLHNS